MLLKISFIFINTFEGIFVKNVERREIGLPALQLASIFDAPLLMTEV